MSAPFMVELNLHFGKGSASHHFGEKLRGGMRDQFSKNKCRQGLESPPSAKTE